jgi:3-isopropylmalate dehydrogenase
MSSRNNKPFKLLVLSGDGIGPEVVTAGLRVFETLCEAEGIVTTIQSDLIGGHAYDTYGTFCRDQTAKAAARVDAILVGAVGGPKWDGLVIQGAPAERDGLMRLRQELDTFAGLRPARSYDALLNRTPFKPEIVRYSDILVLREMCGGLMFREPKELVVDEDGVGHALDTNLYTSAEIERVARVGFQLALGRRNHLVSIDKSNVMDSGILWRDCVNRIGRTEFPGVRLEHYYADNAFYQLMRRPATFDVVLGDNLFGDLASDLAATVTGSLGMLPSACLPLLDQNGTPSGPGIFEPVHGSAPDIMGKDIANPIGTILSVAMMFEYAMMRPDLHERIEKAVEKCLAAGVMTPDIGGTSSSTEVTDKIVGAL